MGLLKKLAEAVIEWSNEESTIKKTVRDDLFHLSDMVRDDQDEIVKRIVSLEQIERFSDTNSLIKRIAAIEQLRESGYYNDTIARVEALEREISEMKKNQVLGGA